jgi:hypothetical protein
MEEEVYLMEHYKLLLDQRFKAFNYFIILSVFADGAAITTLEKIEKTDQSGIVFAIGIFILIVTLAFFILDVRMRVLIKSTTKGLKEGYERILTDAGKHLTRLEQEKSKVFRFTIAFRILFLGQVFMGIFIIAQGLFSITVPLDNQICLIF